VVVRWTDREGNLQQARGCTRDISPKGTYVIASSSPPRGAAVDLDIFLPTLTPESQALRMETGGRVLRVDPSAEKSCLGFSIQIERMVLCRA